MRLSHALRSCGLAVASGISAAAIARARSRWAKVVALVILGSAAAHADCTPASNLVAPHTRATWSEGGIVYDTSTDELKACDGTNYATVSGGASALDDLTDAATEYTTSYTFFVGQNAGISSKGEYVTGVGRYAAYQNSGTHVTGFGVQAAYQNSGTHVIGLGNYAALQNTGNYLTGVGYTAAGLNTSSHVTGVGYLAAYQNSGAHATGLGVQAAYQNSGTYLTAIGSQAGFSNSGNQVTVVGYGAAAQNTGANVTGLGYLAAYQNTAANVVAIGYEAGRSNATANQFIVKQSTVNATPLIQGDFSTGHVGIGTSAPSATLHVVDADDSATQSNFTGALTDAGLLITTDYVSGSYTPGIFWSTGNSQPTKPKAGIYTRNTYTGSYLYLGTSSVYTSGITNNGIVINPHGSIGIGSVTPATSLTVVGEVQVSNSGVSCSSTTQGAIRYNSGTFEFCAGSSWQSLAAVAAAGGAMDLDDLTDAAIDYTTSYTFFVGIGAGALSKGNYVTAVGLSAADSNSGTYVTGVGRVAAYQSFGWSVTGVGHAAAYQNVGDYLTAVGSYAGYLNSGTHVTGLGTNAARQSAGAYVTGVGTNAAYQNSGSSLTGVGVNAGFQNSGAGVTGMGHNSVYQNTGNYVTGLGVNAAYQNTAAYVVAIGYEAGKNNATANQFIVKQSPVNATPLIQGDFGTGNLGIGTTSPTARLDVVSSTAGVAVARFQNGTGACTFTPASSGSGTWSCSSDARLKTDITDAEGRALDWVKDFRIRDYTVKADGSRQTGVIAQEVAKTHPEMVHTGADGMLTVDEPGVWKLVQAIQELKADNDNLRRDLDALKRSLGR